jgi:hypothetical protein
MSRFVTPDTQTLQLSQGDTLVVKKRLNAGERRQMFSAMYRETAAGALKVNPIKTGLSTILGFLLDWSFRDDAGKPVVIRDQPPEVVTAALDALEPESFEEVLRAIEAHEAAMTAEREQAKNAQGGGKQLPVISPSPSS